MLEYISSAAIPIIILLIFTYGIIKQVDMYEAFVSGAKKGISTTLGIFPVLLAMICSVSIFRASGLADFIVKMLTPVANLIHFKAELIPLVIFRPISGSAASAILVDIFKNFSPDSFIGLAASIMAGSTETTLYIISVYLGSQNIKDHSFALKACLLADLVGFIGAYIISLIFFA